MVKAGSGATTYGNASSGGVPADVVKNTYLARYNDIESVRAIFEANKVKIGALIIEPIAGNMGLVPADNEFLRVLRMLCSENGAVLIFDEVMSGFRASRHGSFEFNDIEADLVTFGKVIGGGCPAKCDNTVHVSSGGRITGNIVAKSVFVDGEVSGDILAEKGKSK